MSGAAERDVIKDDTVFKNKSNSSGSCLDVKDSNGLADLNEPLECNSERVPPSRDVTNSHNGSRNITDVQGNDRIAQIDQLHLLRSNYLGSSVGSNAPSPVVFNQWTILPSSWENPMSSSYQHPYSVETNPFMNIDTHARGAGSSFEMNSHVSNGIYQGFSPGSNQSVLSQSFQSLEGPRKQEGSAGFPWLNPQPPHRSEMSNGSTNQFMDGTDTSASAQKGLWSSSYSNNVNMGRVNKINSQSNTEVSGCPIFQKEHTPFTPHSLCIADQHKEARHLVNPDLNIPFDASVSSVNQHRANKEGEKAANEVDQDSGFHSHPKLKIKTSALKDSEALPSLENKGQSSHEKPNEETWGLKQGHDEKKRMKHMKKLEKTAAEAIVAIASSNNGQRLVDDAVSSSTDPATKDPLSWFAEIITSSKDELKRNCEGSRVECSSEGSDYLETNTLKLQPMTVEEYMPTRLLSEHLKFEEETITNQPRKGPGRKRKRKEDFQNDILPVISSLSKREVTEDFQMFELMTTGDQNLRSGMATRRNSKRKQPVELEDSKPTGQGQAAKRPRRQRRNAAGKSRK